jgi:hypothetical protein
VPPLIAEAGDRAARRFLEFFTATFSPAFGMLTARIGVGWMVYFGPA